MASLSFTHFLTLPRCQCHWGSRKFSQLESFRSPERKWSLRARKKAVEGLSQEALLGGDESVVVEKKKKKKKTVGTSSRTTKKVAPESPEEISDSEETETIVDVDSSETVKAPRRTRKKAISASSAGSEEPKPEKKPRGRRKSSNKKDTTATEADADATGDSIIDETEEIEASKTENKPSGRSRKTVAGDTVVSENEASDIEEPIFGATEEAEEEEEEEELKIEEGEDISETYGWPPLVCCFGAAQHAFVPSGRPANRFVNHEIHSRMKDAYWSPEKFVRAPGTSAGSVAIALASLGGKVAFMGKLGTDDYGEAMLYYMNFNNVQTRSTKIDGKRATAVTQMKMSKRGRLRTICVKPCAEDSLTKSDINVDVLKEAKIFYCSTHSLLDPNMRSTTLRAIKISKRLGGIVFYDVNLPMPLWRSREEANSFIQQVWKLADIVEVTKQELEFLLGIEPSEEFDTKNNKASKFVHYAPEVVAPLWHENLKVLFVTNGTSKIHYYTAEQTGAVEGMEDAPLTPFTSDMSASGDGIIAGILRSLSVQLELITDKGYLEHTIKFAIGCGVVDQWALGRVTGFPPREDAEEEVEPDSNGIRSITEREYRTINSVR